MLVRPYPGFMLYNSWLINYKHMNCFYSTLYINCLFRCSNFVGKLLYRNAFLLVTMLCNNTNLVCTLLLDGLLSLTKGRLHRTCLCMQYVIKDYNSSLIQLKQISEVTRDVCLICVRYQQRNSPCRAFNFPQTEGICELLAGDIRCMTDSTSPGTMYVHLSECESVSPWRCLKPSPASWQ